MLVCICVFEFVERVSYFGVVCFICWDYISSYSMASGGHPHATLITMPHSNHSGEDQDNNTSSSSSLDVWTGQVPALSASGVFNVPSDLC